MPPKKVTKGESNKNITALNDKTDNTNQAASYEVDDNTTDDHKYAFDKIVDHTGEEKFVLFFVLWYRYSADSDTANSVENAPNHFIPQNRKRRILQTNRTVWVQKCYIKKRGHYRKGQISV